MVRQTADSTHTSKSHADEGDDGPGTGGEASLPRTEMLDYIADMIGELHDMAGRMGCETLAGILNLALSEARQQATRRDP